MLTFGSLFAGIGGLDLGLERAGMECRWQVEIDPWCRKVLAKHWPDVARYSDVRDVGENLERVDLVCGGFPCQPVSVAGKRLGEADDRWLWPEFARVVRLLRPRYVLVENVPGLLDRGMGNVLGDLSEIGYDAEWESIRASDFGAWHRRERIFLVAYANGKRCGDAPERLAAVRLPSGGDPPRVWARPCESWVDREHDGVPARMDRLRGLGNAVVPQVAEYIGRQIVSFSVK